MYFEPLRIIFDAPVNERPTSVNLNLANQLKFTFQLRLNIP